MKHLKKWNVIKQKERNEIAENKWNVIKQKKEMKKTMKNMKCN